MRIAVREVDAFFRSLVGASLEGVVLNPLKRRIGDIAEIDVFGAVQVALVGIADVVKYDESRSDPIHLVNYYLNEVVEGEPRRYKLSMYARPKTGSVVRCPMLELVESRPFNAWADEDALDEPNKPYAYRGKDWARVGRDFNGVETEMFLVRDENGDGKVQMDECDRAKVTVWSFHDQATTPPEYLDVIRCELGLTAGMWMGSLGEVDSINWKE